MRVLSAASLVLLGVIVARPALALGWPDVPERVDHDLSSADPAVRLAATEKLDALGPLRSAPFILRSLADTDTGVRVAAAEVAARTHLGSATALVLPWLGERDARLRIEACAVARAVPDVRAVAPLARALSDADAVVRASAAEALGLQRSADAVAPLLGKLDDPAWNVRVELAGALARLHDARAVLPLIGKVEDNVPEVRQAVARALGELGDLRAAPALLLQLRDASSDVRVASLAALGRVRSLDTVDAITPSVTDHNASVRHAALATLAVMAAGGASDAVRVLIARLGLDDDATVELDATPLRDALVRAGDPVVLALRGILRGGASPAAATSAAWVLGAIHATSAATDVEGALRRGTLPPSAALRALGGLGTPDDLPVVLEYLGQSSSAVRREALRATRMLLDAGHPDGRAVEPLVAVAENTRLATAELVLVIELLGRTRAPRAAASLQAFLGSRDVSTKLAALDALGELGPADADAAIFPLVTDDAPDVRLHASDALAASGGGAARDALLDLLSSGAELDRTAALTALAGILARAPSGRAWTELSGFLDHVVAGERDAVLLALGRAEPIHAVMALMARSEDADDRRTLMTAAAGRADAVAFLVGGLADPDPSVRAQAAWSLGSTGGPTEVDLLVRLAHGQVLATDVAVNATAALARIGARSHNVAATTSLCGLLAAASPLVRANALGGLALAGVRCGKGEQERALLGDAAEVVRAAAARSLAATPRPEDSAALATCTSRDPSPEVAEVCAHAPPQRPLKTRETLAYVELPPSAERATRGPYVAELADGLLRAGTTDRRAAFFDPVAPDGPIRLRRP